MTGWREDEGHPRHAWVVPPADGLGGNSANPGSAPAAPMVDFRASGHGKGDGSCEQTTSDIPHVCLELCV